MQQNQVATPPTAPELGNSQTAEQPISPRAHLTVEGRRAHGRAARKSVPRESHAGWRAATDRRDPVDVLEEQARSRLPDLVPVRYGRMLASPFAFFRGGAAIMAMDLATSPRTDLHVQLCGDAHLGNFGVFGSPERELLFDINDFDETLPGPFEWDVKRLVTSFVLAARANGFNVAECRSSALAAAAAYRQAVLRFAEMGVLEIWYTHVTIDDITRVLGTGKAQRDAASWIQKARSNSSIKALNKLTRIVDGRREIVDDPPLIERMPPEAEHADLIGRLHRGVRAYRHGLAPEKQHLFDHYRPVEFARKVVGVGSVGTHCYILLLEGRTIDDPLVLQIKEAQQSTLEPYLGKSTYRDHAERVVTGQRWMQAASDTFLGWFRSDNGIDFYLRQLVDMKGSVPIESVGPAGLSLYAQICGSTLARAHARTGDSIAIAGYLGRSARFDEAMSSFANAYADQTERDFQGLVAAHASGRIQAVSGK